ncbi:conserved oligomeric Golgi complex subunit 5-like [Glycine soja]|uniref:Conserved oligomeric Golgi complex subunit 5 n=1 Tax=Glycine soja TaxID=3848 RepID=A0A445LVE7_GLYSO|nr:conserved oligomeric Golgi complex subunit 5-like [Glycine soja]RZC27198.1 Conserved oligomeric Golgi complex subunit 5 isoform A [Glycine soja]RZC27199.1 Conserved oligomeric Golgi complex subunit 5 isoform B [Glycine soja]
MASPAAARTPVSTGASPMQRLSTFKNSSSTTATATTTTSSALDSLASDPIFSAFLSPSFSSTSFSSAALSSGSPASTAEKLHHAIRLLENQLRSEVLSRHHDLLSQLSSLHHADHALSTLRSALSSLQSSVRRLRSELSDPHRSVAAKTAQLSNLHRTTELLQHSIRALRLSKKLRDLMAAPDPEKLDLAKAAQLHFEILSLCDEYDLSGIDAVDEELNWVRETGDLLRSVAMKVLERGMDGLNQAEVGTGLQVFYNLGELKVTVEQVVNKYKGLGAKSVTVALDMKTISGGSGYGPGGIRGSGTPHIGGGAKAREALWHRLGNCMDQLHSIAVAVWHLQRVLSKKRDPFTHVLLLDEAIQEGDPMLTDRVWEAITKAFASQMKSAFTASSFVKEIFTMGYPKLYSMIENLLERISHDTDVKGVLPAINSSGKEQIISAVEIFQNAFLAHCLSRLSDLVNSVFPMSSRGSVPSKEQISRIISRIQEEIEAVQVDARLTLLVLREIGKVLILLAERAEYQISTGPESRQVGGPATPAQLKNFTLCQHLQDVHTRISSILKGMPSIAADVLSASLGALYGVACDSVTALFQAMLDRLESCILQIHDHNFGVLGMDAAMDNNASPYMEELQKCILHFRSEFLSRLLPSRNSTAPGTENICTRLVQSMASRVLVFFIRHASLVRPLSESGKLRMARDMAELELAVGQNLFPVEQLGAPYRALRAFRPLIFLETSQLASSPLLQDLPPNVILHHLYTRAPEELQSPLQRNKLTPLQYSLWLDSQWEDQIWKGIKATLDDYAANVRSRGDKEFSPVYPLMLQLGSSLIEKDQTSSKS